MTRIVVTADEENENAVGVELKYRTGPVEDRRLLPGEALPVTLDGTIAWVSFLEGAPALMGVIEAMQLVHEGKRIRRRAWDKGWVVFKDGTGNLVQSTPGTLNPVVPYTAMAVRDAMAKDWEEVP